MEQKLQWEQPCPDAVVETEEEERGLERPDRSREVVKSLAGVPW